MNFKSIFFLSAIFLIPFLVKSQMSIYVGEGIGRYQFYQGELSTIAWEFNNHSGVTKEMNPNQSFSGLAFGSNFNFNRLNIGLDWARKNNRFGGEYEFGGVKVTDNYVQCINSYYIHQTLTKNHKNLF